MSKIGNLVKELRLKKGITQADLADVLGITDKAVGKWEQGLGDPDLSLIRPLAKFFNISTDELLNGELDVISSDVHKSIYEKIVLSGIDKLPKFTDQGIDLFGQDEYNKTLIDYIYEHNNHKFLDYAIKNNWFEILDVEYTIHIKRDRYLGDKYDNRHILFYLQKNNLNKIKGTIRQIQKVEDKYSLRLTSTVDSNYFLDVIGFDKLTYDLDNILSIWISNEQEIMYCQNIDLLYFGKYFNIEEILKKYAKKTSFKKEFLLHIASIFGLEPLLKLGISNDNKSLIDILSDIFDHDIHSFSGESLDSIVKLNHPRFNQKVLTHERYINDLDIKLVYEYNKYVYDRLSQEKKQKEAHHLVDMIDSNVPDDVILHQDIKDIIKNNQIDLLKKHMQLVDNAVKKIDDFVDYVLNYIKTNENKTFDKVIIEKFNLLFGKYFIYKPFDPRTHFNHDGIFGDYLKEQIALIRLQQKDHSWLEAKLFSSKSMTKSSIYSLIDYTFKTIFSKPLNQISDDALLVLIPYLDEHSKHQLLNDFNRENPEVIKELLLNDAMFYKSTSQRIFRDIEFKYSVIDFRTAYEKQAKKDLDAAGFDLMKTMQFKMLFKN